jgi:hypothetical protein
VGRNAPAPARWLFCEKGLGFLANWRQVLSLFHYVTNDLQRCPPVSILLQGEVPDGAPHGRPSSGELDRPDDAMAGVLKRQEPN